MNASIRKIGPWVYVLVTTITVAQLTSCGEKGPPTRVSSANSKNCKTSDGSTQKNTGADAKKGVVAPLKGSLTLAENDRELLFEDVSLETDYFGLADEASAKYTTEIKPILDKNCLVGSCHKTGSAISPILDTFDGASKAVQGIIDTMQGKGSRMPPLPAALVPDVGIVKVVTWQKQLLAKPTPPTPAPGSASASGKTNGTNTATATKPTTSPADDCKAVSSTTTPQTNTKPQVSQKSGPSK